MIHLGLWLPLLAGLVLLLWPGLGRGFAVLTSLASLAVSLYLFAEYPGEGVAYASQTPFLLEAGVYYAVGLDGAGLLLWLAVNLVVLLGVWLADVPVRFLAYTLMMQTGLLGIFAAQDLVFFYFFFEASLIPALLMLWFYGGSERLRAIYTFALFTLVGSLPMLAAVFAVRFLSGAESFLYTDLAAKPLAGPAATWAFLGFLVAFAVKTPLFPLHAWLPSFHQQNHPSGLADALGTLYKVGIFAFFKWAIPLVPEGFREWQGLLLFLAAFGALYAAWLAFSAPDWKTLLAYAGVSHMGLAALGLFSGTPEGAVGALYLLGASMVYSSAMFLFVGRVYARTGSLETRPVRGLARYAPGLYVLGMFLLMAMIGLPGLSGFPGELMVLLGAYRVAPWLTFLAFLSVIAAAAYALTAFQRLFQEAPQAQAVSDMDAREWAFAGVTVGVLLLMGLYPRLFTAYLEPLGRALGALFGGAS
ncbi:MAG: NADH-quinone oxidoreductase subunit M [Meiothermus sp.]|uniref:complex I subunit 4 family protein n=1 Tax=Meiothermus sp. TaxID=1955249 RepID=UPI0025FE908E|nr:NADH-quinone oxidoreductase subunit M [Meiothermus sp.]MCS7057575.1 NADH-quinone oxidoreductase subunit M [Meiothermus sp.]MCS7195221.1 NADH-quinone oxidoreductase subunit M [Meiothermus sp.]MCX7741386.1 NADH-quinone oxidoreductase subunit M [Meiothermus sp.]MDW8091122.1 NADH-quinone oxidoreductase subunit M [Meiothermus sp.]MDW8482364.1 NADH-quinone oxidoreductase subunit M [Meiothermus sp.]